MGKKCTDESKNVWLRNLHFTLQRSPHRSFQGKDMPNTYFRWHYLVATLEKIAIEIRNLQRTEIAEVFRTLQERSDGK